MDETSCSAAEAMGFCTNGGYFRFGSRKARWYNYAACNFSLVGDFDVDKCTFRVCLKL